MSLETSVPDSKEASVEAGAGGAPPPAPATGPGAQTVVIQPSSGWRAIDFKEIWAYRELLQIMIWRDVTVRYKQTVMGASWAIIQPFMTMVVFTVVFGKIAGIGVEGVPYPILSFSALVPWTMFASGLTKASNSLVGSSYLLKKVYMPRMILPLTSVLSPAVDFCLAFVFLLGLMLYYGFPPSVTLPLMLPFVLLALATSLGASLWLSGMNVQFRDIQHAVPFLVQMWLMATPIPYPSSAVREEYGALAETLQYLNPMTAVVNGFRWAVLDLDTLPTALQLAMSCGVTLTILVTGAYVFRRMERTFADVV